LCQRLTPGIDECRETYRPLCSLFPSPLEARLLRRGRGSAVSAAMTTDEKDLRACRRDVAGLGSGLLGRYRPGATGGGCREGQRQARRGRPEDQERNREGGEIGRASCRERVCL